MTSIPGEPVSHPVAGVAAKPWFWAAALAASAGAGLLYALALRGGNPVVGALYGTLIGLTVLSFERGLILAGFQRRLRRLPTLIYVPLSEATYLALILVSAAASGLVCWTLGLIGGTLLAAITPGPADLAYSCAVCALFVFVIRMRDLVGSDVFWSLIIGRYHQPIEEARVFLFLDVVGSTAFAERHGNLEAQAYLGAFFAALAEPVRRHGGSIDDYIGDMALITWPLVRGTRGAACVACVFDVMDALARDAERWRARFGHVPRFRAALHGGPVVTAEIGIDRHKITYFGDAVNITSRIEALCRSLDAPILMSADLLHQLAGLPAGIFVRPLGGHAVRGRDQRLDVVALERESMSRAA